MASNPPAPQVLLLTSPAVLGAAVRTARTALGLSLRDAATRARVGKRFFLEVEQGKPSVRFDKLLAVMSAVNLLALVLPLDVGMAALGPRG